MTTWSGRIEGALDPEVWRFLRVEDAELLPYDCEATAEHARRLAAAGILTDDERDEVEARLAEIALEPDCYLESDEDVHSAIERLLGDVGRKIQAGRSRNDQVCAALRLYVLDAAAESREAIDALSGRRAKPNSLLVQRQISSPIRERCAKSAAAAYR